MDPSRKSIATDAMSAHKRAAAARSWFPDGPTVSGLYMDDHFIGSKVGYTTYQGQISVPLWLPGQGSATEEAALADEKVAAQQQQVQKLAVAVRVLDLASEGAVLSARISNQEVVSDVLGKTMSDVEHALHAGEVASTDYEATVTEKEDLDGTLAESRQRLENIRADLESLTGTDALPDLSGIDGRFLGRIGTRLDPERDPRVQLADSALKQAQASYSVARHSYMPNPQLGVILSRQEQYQSPWDTQIGVEFQVPLPSEARNVPMVMKEVQAVGRAERDVTQAHRQIRAEYRQLHNQLTTSTQILQHARQLRAHSDRRAADLAEAWQVGEIPVIEYLRARRTALTAAERYAQADIVMRATIARMILMSGNIP
ncbi:TolC family protein [Acetobacter sp.]|jgi:outer membrane protein TolC|uniref:TolC family protein n=1 Tax=Acetobacter sp. TaxID=440 RepID=UPI0025C016A3|nr:TolC family protein [Acetobacter sp.]MCH4091047.1 TolC family protein [Acetobacter sp.]MCI1300230.1 TolC family protein [Acetobacter sp.]MCI1316102.1 TolC family protein [Acetobacter sp.]